MQLQQIDKIYVLHCSFHEKDNAKEMGFRWNPELKRWQSMDIDVAIKAIIYAPPVLAESLAKYIKQKEQALSLSKTASFSGDKNLIIFPKGIEPYEYQKVGIEYALQRQNVLFADDMGLGKTMQAIGVINKEHPQRILIVCPNSLKINWAKELAKFCTHQYDINIIGSDSKFNPAANVNIINYDILAKYDNLQNQDFDLLIADEVHYAKNYKAQRSKALYGLKAKRKIAISGTPMNKPIELYYILRWLNKGLFPNYVEFGIKYCNGSRSGYSGAWDFSGASNLEELQEKLRANIMVRRLKKDVLKELPAKTRQIIELDGLSKAEQVEQKRLWDKFKDEYESAAENLSIHQMKFDEIAKIRKETAIKKISAAISFVKDILENSDEKLVLFAHHKEVIQAIKNELAEYEPLIIVGDTSLKERDDCVEQFQKNPTKRVFIGSIMACAEGLTLTASSTVIFLELLFSPDKMCQAEDRVHRIGQEDKVKIYHLVLNGSIDANMVHILVRKQRYIEKTLNTK